MNKALLLQIMRFGTVGVLASLVHFSCVVFFVQLLHWLPLVANIIGFGIGVQVSYWGAPHLHLPRFRRHPQHSLSTPRCPPNGQLHRKRMLLLHFACLPHPLPNCLAHRARDHAYLHFHYQQNVGVCLGCVFAVVILENYE